MHDGKEQFESPLSRVLGPQRLDSADSYGVDEFPAGADEWLADEPTRRSFLKRMSAALALAGLVGCNDRPQGEAIVPHVDPPDNFIPGKPMVYASAMVLSGYARGVRVTSREGRPIKIEGNPEHPASLGSADVFMQASILDLYDPARAKTPTRGGSAVDWQGFRTALKDRTDGAHKNGGRGLRVLSGAITSPTLISQIAEAARQFPEAQWHFYDPMARSSGYAATAAAFGRALNPVYDFSKAKVIVSLDSDFLFDEPGSLRYARQFSDARRVRKDQRSMSRLYVAESSLTLAGSMADHRFTMKPSEIAGFAQGLLEAVGGSGGARPFRQIADDLLANRGASVVIAGPNQPAAVHQAAYAINAALGNIGQTVRFTEPLEPRANDATRSLAALVADMEAGKVDTLIIVGENPAFSAPADIPFAAALKKLSTERSANGFKNFTAHLSLYANETSFLSQWHLPETHYLEAWSDARAFDGTVSIVQPLIAPLYGGRSAHEVLAEALGGAKTGYEIVRNYWKSQIQGDFEGWWRNTLKRGVVENSAAAAVAVGAPKAPSAPETSHAPMQVAFRPDYSVWDGSFNRNAWLQELPRPFSKLVWDNVALISPGTLQQQGLKPADMVRLTVAGRSMEIPVWPLPGMPDGVLNVALGYGSGQRPANTEDGVGAHGFNAYAVRTTGVGFAPVELVKLGTSHNVVGSMNHWAMSDGKERLAPNAIATPNTDAHKLETDHRRLVRVIPLPLYQENPNSVKALGGKKDNKELLTLFNGGWDYSKGYQWGMSIDTTACIGCNACVIACQSENNIPVVGKEEVDRQREMHWLRIDDYFAEAGDQPIVTHEPVPCMHCENAPCEYVCPVGATSHSADGLNQMTYNRCVGTRYCSNNCPYKVRRFNFLSYSDPMRTEQRKLQNNPEVTVRTRGVMEKCSYCVQRISRTRIEVEAMLLDMDDLIEKAATEDEKGQLRAERDRKEFESINGLQTACQQTCPTQAIIFGSINPVGGQKPEAMKLRNEEPLTYSLLRELTTIPRTTYLARVRNLNPALA